MSKKNICTSDRNDDHLDSDPSGKSCKKSDSDSFEYEKIHQRCNSSKHNFFEPAINKETCEYKCKSYIQC